MFVMAADVFRDKNTYKSEVKLMREKCVIQNLTPRKVQYILFSASVRNKVF